VADAKGGRIAVELHVPAAVAAREGYARLWHRYPSRFCAERNHSIYFFVWLKNVYGTEPFYFWFGLRFCVDQNYSIYCLVRHNTTSLIRDFDKYIVLKVVSSQILGRHESLIALL
jgi:hypothetical protein